MPDDPDWVLLVECYNMAELHTLRATLEARGVPCRLYGEHTHGILGPIHGAMARSRVLVPRRALPLARELAEDIVGPFDEAIAEGGEADEDSPFRTAAELPDAANERAQGEPPLRRKSYAVLVLVVLLGGMWPLFGLVHFYVRRNVRGWLLAITSLFALIASYHGAAWGSLLLVGAWLTDLIGGAQGIAAHNRRVAALAAAQPEPDDDDDEG